MALADPPDLDGRGSRILSAEACHRLLEEAAGGVGRLGFAVSSRVNVLPVNYEYLGEDLLVCLGPGGMLEALASEPVVAFEVDWIDAAPRAPEAWSVLVHGRARVVRNPIELEEVSALGVTPSVAEPGAVFVRIAVEAVSGRRFPVGALARFALGRRR